MEITTHPFQFNFRELFSDANMIGGFEGGVIYKATKDNKHYLIIDEVKLRTSLLDNYNIEIGAGLGELAGKVWRIGLMGYSSNKKNINACVSALKEILER